MILELEITGSRITGIVGFGEGVKKHEARYNFIKVDPLAYPEYLAKTWISKRDSDIVLRVVQEDNYSQAIPNQIFECTIKNGDFTKD